MKIFEKNAPGPSDYFPYDKPEKPARPKPLIGTPCKNQIVKSDPMPGPADYFPFEFGVKKDEVLVLHKFEVTKPRHGTPGKMMKPIGLEESIKKKRD